MGWFSKKKPERHISDLIPDGDCLECGGDGHAKRGCPCAFCNGTGKTYRPMTALEKLDAIYQKVNQ